MSAHTHKFAKSLQDSFHKLNIELPTMPAGAFHRKKTQRRGPSGLLTGNTHTLPVHI